MAWAAMIPEMGIALLAIALGAALAQVFLILKPFHSNHREGSLKALMAFCAWIQLTAVAGALALLIILRITDDFSIANVAANSNTGLPLVYKITGAWGNHEGSMVLFALVMALFGALLTSEREPGLIHTARGIQGALTAGVLLFILFTSNPFERLPIIPTEGADLNPLLQDIGLAIHPPLLYAGYVGFSLTFSLAVAGLLHRRLDSAWAALACPWILVAWSFLTFGIGLGSWWAYRELGWGGWWFWDPVENASLLPWLAGIALLHSAMVLERRGALASWVGLLAILTFAMSLLGTFLVRSGLITSVHSFASDPARGIFILAYITLSVGAALVLYAIRIPPPAPPPSPASQEGLIVIGNLFFVTALATVLLGTLYPVLTEWLGTGRINVGAPYYSRTFLPLMAAPVLLAGLATLRLKHWQAPLLAALTAAFIVLAVADSHAALAALGFMLAIWLITATARYAIPFHFTKLPATLAHTGAALLVAGITASSLWQQESEITLLPGESVTLGGHHFLYRASHQYAHANYFSLTADIETAGQTLHPAYRYYPARATGTSESAILSTPWRDIYTVLGAPTPGGTPLRIYINPLMQFLWAGCLLMGAGGVTAAWRRLKL